MKKFVRIGCSLLLNFVLLAVGISFYATDETGGVAKGTTDIPVILFLVGCYVAPWIALRIPHVSKGLRVATIGLFSWSFFFTWTLLAMTEGFFSGFLNLLSLFGSIILPLVFFLFVRRKENAFGQSKEQEVEQPNGTAQTVLHPLDSLKAVIEKIKDPDVHRKGQEIVTLLTSIQHNIHTLDTEEMHIINRLISSDVMQLLKPYLHLSKTKQDEIESDIVHNLDIIERYLHSVMDGVSNTYVNEIKTSMHLIEKRYKK